MKNSPRMKPKPQPLPSSGWGIWDYDSLEILMILEEKGAEAAFDKFIESYAYPPNAAKLMLPRLQMHAIECYTGSIPREVWTEFINKMLELNK